MTLRDHDIKAPDGFLLGGQRLVRRGGVILFQRGYYQAPAEWTGDYVWVHCSTDSGAWDIEIAPPGLHIYTARSQRKTVLGARTKRPDAKPGFRRPENKAWVSRSSSKNI
jgi:hypothetical protein